MTDTDADADTARPDRGYQSFASWADAVLSDVPRTVCAFCFLLEETKPYWTVDLAGITTLDPDDEEWACDPAFGPVGELRVRRKWDLREWEGMLTLGLAWLHQYLADDRPGAHRLRASRRVAIGFVDGDIHVVWPAGPPPA